MSAVPVVTGVQLTPPTDPAEAPGEPLLVVGHSLGTSAETLWGATALALADTYHVVGWDLPGHGRSAPPADGYSMAELAQGVLDMVDAVLVERGEPGASFEYAGDSIGGAVGLALLLDHPGRVSSATLLGTGARIGTAQGWSERAELVRASGTAVMVETNAASWFGPGFLQRDPRAANALLHALRETDRFGYAWACEALGAFDVRDRLGEITVPVLAVGGRHDESTPVASLGQIAETVRHGRLVVLDHVAHQVPAEAPAEVARLIRGHRGAQLTVAQQRAAGQSVRRSVLGDAYVDAAAARVTDFTREFQDLIAQYAWGTIWTRPGLDRRARSMITLTALVARGHHEELALHVRAARTNGLTDAEIKETLLQAAIYCGVPDANTAFRIAQGVLAELDADGTEGAEGTGDTEGTEGTEQR